jgi:hypothetical protein
MRPGWIAALLALAGCELAGGIDQKVHRLPGGTGEGGAAGQGVVVVEPPGRRPPARPSGKVAPQDGRMLTFAARRIRFGKHNPDGTKNPEAWRRIGFDIDGQNTTAETLASGSSGKKHCLRAKEETAISTFEDGEEGRDNVFGSKIAPLLGSLASSAQGLENDISEDITLGSSPTLLVVLDDVNDGPDDPYVTASVYASAAVPGQPTRNWDGNDVFQVAPASILANSISSPRSIYVSGYLRGNTYVSGSLHAAGSSPPIYLPIAADTELLVFNVSSSTLVIELDEDHTLVQRATLSAVLTPQNLEAPMKQLIDRYLCANEVVQKFAYQQLATLHELPDLFLGGASFQDDSGTRPCDALSVAIELELVPILPLTTVFKGQPLPYPCPASPLRCVDPLFFRPPIEALRATNRRPGGRSTHRPREPERAQPAGRAPTAVPSPASFSLGIPRIRRILRGWHCSRIRWGDGASRRSWP